MEVWVLSYLTSSEVTTSVQTSFRLCKFKPHARHEVGAKSNTQIWYHLLWMVLHCSHQFMALSILRLRRHVGHGNSTAATIPHSTSMATSIRPLCYLLLLRSCWSSFTRHTRKYICEHGPESSSMVGLHPFYVHAWLFDWTSGSVCYCVCKSVPMESILPLSAWLMQCQHWCNHFCFQTDGCSQEIPNNQLARRTDWESTSIKKQTCRS